MTVLLLILTGAVALLALGVGVLSFLLCKARRTARRNARYAQGAYLWNLVKNTLPLHFFAKSPGNDFRYVFSSAARAKFYGRQDGFFEGKNDFDFLPTDIAGKRRAEDLETMKAGGKGSVNLIVVPDSEGKLHHLKIMQFPCKGIDGEPMLLGFSLDVSELAEAEKSEEEKNTRLNGELDFLRTLVDSLPFYISVKDINDDFLYIYCNKFFYERLGLRQENVIGRREREIFENRGNYLQWSDWDREAVRADKPIEHIAESVDLNGNHTKLKVRWISARLSGGRNWLFIIASNVTELEAAQQEAKKRLDWLRLTFNSIGDGVLTTDAEGRVEMMNPVAERMLGITTQAAVGQPHEKFFNIVSYLDDRPMYSVVTRALRTGAIVELANHTDLLSQDGKRYHISDSAAPIRDADGKIKGAILVFRDVTEEYAQRDRLRDALFLLEFGAEQTRTASFRMKIGTREITGSKLLDQILPVKDGRLAKAEEYVSAEDLLPHKDAMQSLLDHRLQANQWTYHSSFSGRSRVYRMAAAINWDKTNEPVLYGVVQDITEIFQMSAKLKNSQNLFRLAINSMPVIIFGKSINSGYRYVISNPRFTAFAGRRYEEIIGHTDQEIFNTWPEDAKAYREWDDRIVAGGKPVTFIEDPMNAQGQRLHLQTTKIPVIGLNNEKLLLGISMDITESTNLAANTQIVAEMLKQIVIETDFNKIFDQIVQTFQRQIDPDRVILARYLEDGNFHFYRDWHSGRVQPIAKENYHEHEQVWSQHIPQMLANQFVQYNDVTVELPAMRTILGKEKDYQIRTVMSAPVFIEGRLWGAIMTFFSWKRPVIRSDEHLMRSVANIIELANIRESENRQLQEADNERQMILEHIDIPIILYDDKGHILRVNKLVADESGLPMKEMMGCTCEKIFHCDGEQRAKCPVQQAISTGKTQTRFYTREGREYYVYARPVFGEGKKVVHVVRSAVDVTELNNLIKNEQVMSTCLETFLGETDMKKAINQVLEIICKRAGATRAYVCQFFLDRKRLSCVHEYLEPGRKPFFISIQDQPYNTYPDWDEIFKKTELITMNNAKADAARWGVGGYWLDIRDRLDIRSYFAARILVNGKFWGYLAVAYENKTHELQSWEPKFYAAAAHVIELMLRHLGAQAQIRDALARAQAADAEKTVALFNEQTMNACLGTLFEEENFDVALQRLLETICQHYCASYSFIYRYDFAKNENWIDKFYCAPGRKVDVNGLKRHPINPDSPWMKLMLKHERFISFDMGNPTHLALMPDWTDVLQRFKIRIIVLHPIFCRGKLWGNFAVACDEEGVKACNLSTSNLALQENTARMIEILLDRQAASKQVTDALAFARAADAEKTVLLANEKTVNLCLDTLFREEDFDLALETVLKTIATHYHASHCFNLRFDYPRKMQMILNSYAAPGETLDLRKLPGLPIDEKAPWYEKISHHELVAVPDINSPEAAAVTPDWIAEMRALGIRSLYGSPVFRGSQFWGTLSLIYMDDAGKHLTPNDLLLLQNAAHMIEIILGRQAAARQVMDALEKARAADKAKSFFIASVSHEIRTPLNAVIGFTELLKDSKLTAETRQDYLDSISYSGNTLLQLINDVLDLSKLEAGQMKLVNEPLSVGQLGHDIMRVFSFRSKERGLELHVGMDAMPVLALDRLRMRQILFNLIGNAVKFTEHGSITLAGDFTPTGKDEGTLNVTVTDTGIGISPENQVKLMEPFVQLPGMRGTNASNTGTGLGLAISKRLAERMGGKLWIKSEAGKGSTFGLTLYHVPVAGAPSARGTRLAENVLQTKGCDISKLSVLLVDDVRMNLKVMQAQCVKAGVKVVGTASSGADAMKALEARPYDVVLTDLWMPGMSGPLLAEKIHADIRFARMPIVAVTADVEAKDNFTLTAFSAVLLKPVTTEKLLALFKGIR